MTGGMTGGFLDRDQFLIDLRGDMTMVAAQYRGDALKLTEDQRRDLLAAAVLLAGAMLDGDEVGPV